MENISTSAFAKLNLALEILGKRPDGFHDIRSVFLAVTLADELEFTARDDGRIVLDANDPHLPTDGRNLIVRAAQLLKEQYHLAPALGAGIRLTKNIPIGAGLGGGSSDAAAALRSLNTLWGIGATAGDLAALGARIGSDVPFFLAARSALVTGRGEIIEPLAFPRMYHFVITYPGFPVSTAWAYKNYKNELTNRPEYSKILTFGCLNSETPVHLAPLFHNDFEPLVIRSHPGIADAKAALFRCGAAGAMMSGSGSSVFGIFSDRAAAVSARERVRTEWPCSYAVSSLPDVSE